MSDSDIKSIVRFFFFTMLDEKRSLLASSQAIEICRQKLSKTPNLNISVLIVSVTDQVWGKHRERIQRGRPQFSIESGWRFPEGLDLAPWKEFQRKAPEEELLALTWSKILGYSDDDISLGLGLTEGTFRFRVGRALRKMGSYCRTTANSLRLVKQDG